MKDIEVLARVSEMAEQSLSPEHYSRWEELKSILIGNRKSLRQGKDNRCFTDIINALYKSEINISITSFYDAGFQIKIGDEMNGFCDKMVETHSLDHDCLERIVEIVHEAFPNSLFSIEEKRRSARYFRA
jgi:hypothetical protein